MLYEVHALRIIDHLALFLIPYIRVFEFEIVKMFRMIVEIKRFKTRSSR